MNEQLTDLQKQLLTVLQMPLPISARPFGVIAKQLGVTHDTIITETRNFIDSNWIRRLRPQINYRSLGRVAVLATAHLEPDQVEKVGSAISSVNMVSHNYIRDHYYNLWFTLQAGDFDDVNDQLALLSIRCSVKFHAMPATKLFKLNVFFRLADNIPVEIAPRQVNTDPVELTEVEKTVLTRIQQPFPVTADPFRAFADDILTEEMIIESVYTLQEKNVIRRIAAVVNYIRLGFKSNVMFCAKVDPDHVDTVGSRLAAIDIVSHCYERKTFEGFDYNIFAMMHGKDQKQIDDIIDEICSSLPIDKHACLNTVKELKKKPVIQSF